MATKKINTNTNLSGSISVTKKEPEKENHHILKVTLKIIITVFAVLSIFALYVFISFYFEKLNIKIDDTIMYNLLVFFNNNMTYIIITGIIFVVRRAYK